MTYRDPNFEEMLLKQSYEDKAASYVQKVLREVEDYANSTAYKPFMQEAVGYYLEKLRGIERAVCDCCHIEITNVHHRAGLILGSECVSHPGRFPCHAQPLSMKVQTGGSVE